MPALPTRMRITAEDKVALAAYWKFFEPLAPKINDALRASLMQLPEWAPILKSQTPSQIEQQERESRERQRGAFLDGEWVPYLDDLRKQGIAYANLGVSFVAWYDIIAIYRDLIRKSLVDTNMDRDEMVK